MSTVECVAKYVLMNCGPMTTMKLQKIVYYCQAWSLAWDEKPLFEDEFEAWANGPVCLKLFNYHRGQFVIDADLFQNVDVSECFSKENIETMDAVIRDYSNKSPQWLSDLTHNEKPWKNARGSTPPGEYCSTVISKHEMQSYYSGL